ncbi:MAG: hypothetical protein ACREIT_01045 [Tepidisphaeraceae bacterium]
MEGPNFNAESYRASAVEAITAAQVLYNASAFGKSLYLSGLAVECMLRAYRMRINPMFSSRHDLVELQKESGITAALDEVDGKAFSDALAVVRAAWRNAHRFASDAAISRFLKQVRLDRGIKGSFLKEIARRTYNAALRIVAIGERAWTVSNKK